MLSTLAILGLAYTLYLAIYALYTIYLHPVHQIPGPKLWIAFPVMRHLSNIRGTLDINLRAFHAHYGHAVRFAPDEVSFTTAQAWKDIYGYHHRQLPKVRTSEQDPRSIINADDANHSRYRKALAHAFSARGLQAQEPILRGYVDKLIERLKGVADSRLPADMVKWYNLTTFDLIGDLAFGEPFGGLESSEYHHWVATIFQSIRALAFIRLRDEYPFLFRCLKPLIPKGLVEARRRQQDHSEMTVVKRLQSRKDRGHADFMDSMLRHQGDKEELTVPELVQNANILIVAGSETTATLLSGVTYWLLRTPEVMDKVVREVRETMRSEEEITFNNASTRLPYMLACIQEGFRMYPPVPAGLQRMTLPGADTDISGYTVPPNTKVAVHQSAAYLSTHNFHDPYHFMPERWLPEAKEDPSSPFYHDQRDVLQPFSTGPRNCIGKNLAYSEMRIILARVLWNFDLELCEESWDWSNQRSFALWEKPPLMCLLKRVRRDAGEDV